MDDQTTMDPADFRRRMNDSFGLEPPHAPLSDDLRRGATRLRLRRLTTSVAALAAVGVVGAGVAVMPPWSAVRPLAVAPAAPPSAANRPAPSPAEILARCTTGENAFFLDGTGSKEEGDAVRLLGQHPTLMTSAVIDNRTHATLRSADGRYWASCQFRNVPDNGVKNALTVYPTAVSFPRKTVEGVAAYEPASEADGRFVESADTPLPWFEVPCVSNLEGAERDSFDASCPEFTMTWNDRRPADVAAVKVVTPDGKASWADVRGGYLSFAYTGDMTPRLSEQVSRGGRPEARRVVFYDSDGEVLVDDRHPGHAPGRGKLSIASFPSLAWWSKAARQ